MIDKTKAWRFSPLSIDRKNLWNLDATAIRNHRRWTNSMEQLTLSEDDLKT